MTDDHNPDDPQSPWDAMAQADPRLSDEPQPGPTVINMAQERQNRARAEGKRASRFFAAAALDGRDVPERNWLVRDLIPSGTVTPLSGDGGTGKSLIALQLAAACALGKPWLGRAVASGQALFISAEDDQDELHRRLADVIEAEGVGFADLDRLSFPDRKIVLGSTPVHEDTSHVLRAYAQSDQRVFEVPCPGCGSFSEITWDEGAPEAALTFSEAVMMYPVTRKTAKQLLPITAEIGHMPLSTITGQLLKNLGPKMKPTASVDTWWREIV
ncbi:MAG: AAA family ATPase, partial [Paracoccus sp. (in: a-proteobacteria)]